MFVEVFLNLFQLIIEYKIDSTLRKLYLITILSKL